MSKGSVMDANALIVGAGPAGTAAALALLNVGFAVTIMDHTPFPRHRPGETLPPAIEPLLARLDASQLLRDTGYLRHEGHWVDWATDKVSYSAFGNDAKGPWQGIQAPRDDWDQRLLALVIERGARFVQRSPHGLRWERDGLIVFDVDAIPTGAFVVDCSGTSRWLARRLKIPLHQYSRSLIARYGYMRGDLPANSRLPMIRAEADGWTWLAKVAPQRFHWTRVTTQEYAQDKNWIPDEFKTLSLERSYGADVTWRLLSKTAGRRWFIAGDAAATLDPSSSHGVLRAMMSGMMAAHLIAAINQRLMPETDAARFYHRWLTNWFEHDAKKMRGAYLEGCLFDPTLLFLHRHSTLQADIAWFAKDVFSGNNF